MATVLVVHHSPTDRVRQITEAVLDGAGHDAIEGVDLQVKPALEATVDDVLAADGYLLGSTANFGYLSGALKHFFDSTYDATREPTAKRPFSYWIHGGYDTTGAERAMQSITAGYGWNLVAEPLVFTGEFTEEYRARAVELGGTVAATLMA